MKWDFRHHLLLQIEMLRGDLSHEELSQRLGDISERSLARYIAGKSFFTDSEFKAIARALRIDSDTLARAWAASLGLSIPAHDATDAMVDRARQNWHKHSRLHGVPCRPSPMAVIRAKYAHLLPVETPPLWFGAHFTDRPRKGTPENRARFARAYEMLLESVHLGMTAKDIGARRGISGERARQLMVFAAYTWARSERLDISDKSVPFKNEAKFVKQLYAGLRFFAQQKFNELEKVQALKSASRKRKRL